ncbi:MAG: hypothetical protein JWN58_2691 [Gammaproteobacteria bacterium]|nr:hypothetical protein [Gammaproteobacteria bacterium]
MPPNSTYTAEALLNLLLDRFEAPKARVRDITQPIDYTKIGGPVAQDDFHRILHDAERAGGIALERDRLARFTGELARIRLTDADSLYRFLVRSPAGTMADTARRTIEATIPEILEEPFFAEIEQEAVVAWTANKRFLGLTPNQIETFVTILRLAHGIVHLAGRDVDHRTFSRRVVKDSKALERSEGRVAQLLKRHNHNLAGDEPREILEASGIVRRAHLLQVKGPLRLSSDDLEIRGTGQVFIGLPWAAVRKATLTRPVDYILTIENPTSFWRYCTEIEGCYLALLSDGFPARDVLSSMTHFVGVARALQETPVFHWGDIDAGGVRIAAHLADSFAVPVDLHEMSPALALKFGIPLQSRNGLDRLATREGDIGELARWLSTDAAMALEQEELDPRVPEGALR